MNESIVVIGIGNPYRRDDGVGLEVLRRVEELRMPGVRCMESDGESTALCDAWNGAALAVVIDAVRSGAAPGTLHVTTMGADAIAVHTPRGGSHALSLAEALALGEVLDRLPLHLLVVGVEAGDVGDGLGLSDAVASAVAPAVDAVRDACAGVGAR
jgi:hydrogenase maturation protease